MKKLSKEQFARDEGYTMGYTEGAADVVGQIISRFINEFSKDELTLIECANGSNKKFLELLIKNVYLHISKETIEMIIDLGRKHLVWRENLRKKIEDNYS